MDGALTFNLSHESQRCGSMLTLIKAVIRRR